MNNNDWYGNSSWYAPLSSAPIPDPSVEAVRKQDKKKKKKRTALVIAAIVLVLAVIIGTSVAFAQPAVRITVKSGSSADSGSGSGSGDSSSDSSDLPDDFKDFFSSFYTSTDSTPVVVDIERTTVSEQTFETAAAEGDTLPLSELYSACSPAVVGIKGFESEDTDSYNWGSGFIISSDGLVVTNTHVIDGCCLATVLLADGTEYEAKLVGADGTSDIAVLKIEASGLPTVSFGDSSALSVGDEVAAIGNPLGETFTGTLTNGIISAIERGINYNGRTMTLLQTNTALNEGNSGGALFNMYGQVVGVTNMKMMSSLSNIEGIGFAIPSTTAVKIVNALIRDGEVRGRTSIGITVGAIPTQAKEKYNLPDGLYIAGVTEGSDAEAQGLQEGDVITAVNGIAVTVTQDISDIKDQYSVGDKLTFTIYRDGKTFDVDVTLMDTNDVYG